MGSGHLYGRLATIMEFLQPTWADFFLPTRSPNDEDYRNGRGTRLLPFREGEDGVHEEVCSPTRAERRVGRHEGVITVTIFPPLTRSRLRTVITLGFVRCDPIRGDSVPAIAGLESFYGIVGSSAGALIGCSSSSWPSWPARRAHRVRRRSATCLQRPPWFISRLCLVLLRRHYCSSSTGFTTPGKLLLITSFSKSEKLNR